MKWLVDLLWLWFVLVGRDEADLSYGGCAVVIGARWAMVLVIAELVGEETMEVRPIWVVCWWELSTGQRSSSGSL